MKHQIVLSVAFNLLFCLLGYAKEGWKDVREVWKNPTPYLEKIQYELADFRVEDYERERTLAFEIQNLAYAVNQEIMSADSPTWYEPTPEREAIIKKWGQILQPYTQDLVKVALEKDTAYTSVGKQSRSLLDFAPPSKEFAEQVRNYVRATDPQSTEIAADLLYEHRLLSPEDKDVIKKLISLTQTDEERVRLAQHFSVFEMTDWDVFLIEQARSLLKGKPTGSSPEDVITYYGPALSTAYVLGTRAAVLLPELESLRDDPVVKGAGYSSHFERACNMIIGKTSPQGRVAKNGSGPLSSWLISESQGHSKAGPSSMGEPPSPSKLPELTPLPAPPSEEPASSTLWSIIVVLVVAAIGLLWMLLNKCK